MESSPQNDVVIYTDGACHPNPGPGGWGVVILRPEQEPEELSGGEPDSTNNRMELWAAIQALKSLSDPHQITLYTDSQYLRQGITKWLPNWRKTDWQTKNETPVKNRDLWETLAAELERHKVAWHWTKGHANDPWNERADKLASSAIPAPQLPLNDDQALHIFTAVAYSGKEKKGGCGILLRYRDNIKTISKQETNTSSNRLHIQSAVTGLQAVKRRLPIHLYTSSDYLKDGATTWVNNWSTRNWKTRDGKDVKHRDLWEELQELTRQYEIHWHVVPGEHLPEEMVQAKQLAKMTISTS